jgi:hypothetical protein
VIWVAAAILTTLGIASPRLQVFNAIIAQESEMTSSKSTRLPQATASVMQAVTGTGNKQSPQEFAETRRHARNGAPGAALQHGHAWTFVVHSGSSREAVFQQALQRCPD